MFLQVDSRKLRPFNTTKNPKIPVSYQFNLKGIKQFQISIIKVSKHSYNNFGYGNLALDDYNLH